MSSAASKYRFGPYQLSARTHELYKHGIRLKLRPQAFHVLHALLERAPDAVTREELRQELWSSETFVDFEHGLNTAIKELRGMLSDSSSQPRYIETIPKLGYRMIAAVEREAAEAVAAGQVTSTPHHLSEVASRTPVRDPHFPAGTEPAQKAARNSKRRWLALATTCLVLLAAAGFWQWRRSSVPAGTTTRIMLAVLPFQNLTGDASQEYFSDGLTEEMISQLGRSDPQRLGVIARTSVMRYKNGHEPLDQIGRELGVQYVLEGSVRRDAKSVRISAQLIQLKDQTHIWARQYDRELSSLLALQGEIAQEVADEIQLTLGQKRVSTVVAASTPSTNTEAYDLYLRGMYFWNKRSREAFEEAVTSFQQSIAKDPSYAPAYAGLADTYALLSNNNAALPARTMQQARTAALKALQLDDTLAEAHTSLALITENFDYDWQTAEKEYRRAIELNPNYATAHHWYAEYLMWQGRFDEALRESERARQLDPLSLIIAADRGAIFYYSRQYDRAIEQSRAVLAIDAHFVRASTVINAAYLRKGMFSEALAHSDKDLSHCASDPWVCGWLAYVYAIAGKPAKARPALKELERLDRIRPILTAPLIAASIGLGHNDDAIRYLERACSERSSSLTALKVDELYDPLRSDPRFQDLLRCVHLAP